MFNSPPSCLLYTLEMAAGGGAAEDDYSARVAEPALVIIRSRLMRDRPVNVIQYISEHGDEIRRESEALVVPARWQSESGDPR